MNMQSRLLSLVWVALLTVAMIAPAGSLRADDAAKKSTLDDPKGDEPRGAAFIRAMRTMASGLKVFRVTDDGEDECKMVDDSVLNWSDSARHPDLVVPGTTWIWHHNGRPEFIAEIYGRTNAVGQWHLFGCTLSPDRLRVGNESGERTVTKSYYEPAEVPGAPAVAKTKAERTFQMRQLASRFESHQFWEERYELRLLTKPVYRYEDVASGIMDGAVFALVHGTNPEVILLIEAHARGGDNARWKVAFGSLAGAQCIVRLDGTEYWTCPRHIGQLTDPRLGFDKAVPVALNKNAADENN
jgi:hypothetical protein